MVAERAVRGKLRVRNVLKYQTDTKKTFKRQVTTNYITRRLRDNRLLHRVGNKCHKALARVLK